MQKQKEENEPSLLPLQSLYLNTPRKPNSVLQNFSPSPAFQSLDDNTIPSSPLNFSSYSPVTNLDKENILIHNQPSTSKWKKQKLNDSNPNSIEITTQSTPLVENKEERNRHLDNSISSSFISNNTHLDLANEEPWENEYLSIEDLDALLEEDAEVSGSLIILSDDELAKSDSNSQLLEDTEPTIKQLKKLKLLLATFIDRIDETISQDLPSKELEKYEPKILVQELLNHMPPSIKDIFSKELCERCSCKLKGNIKSEKGDTSVEDISESEENSLGLETLSLKSKQEAIAVMEKEMNDLEIVCEEVSNNNSNTGREPDEEKNLEISMKSVVLEDNDDSDFAIETFPVDKQKEKIIRPSPVKPKIAKSHPLARERGLVDIFSEESVKNWSLVRIQCWEARWVNPEAFYYRFTDPGELQSNGAFTAKERDAFVSRLDEFKKLGIRIGTCWGTFSMKILHKAGYQCSAYYRKLIQLGKVEDSSYSIVDNKLKMVQKVRGGKSIEANLSSRWETEEVRNIENNVNEWIQKYHGRSPVLQGDKSLKIQKTDKAKNTAKSEKTSPQKEKKEFSKSTFTSKPQESLIMGLENRISVDTRMALWTQRVKQKQKQKLSKALLKPKQNDLSSFWSFVKPAPAPEPEPVYTKMPFPIPQSWAKIITPLCKQSLPKLNNFITLENNLATLSKTEWKEILQNHNFDGILMDPPWSNENQEVYVTIPIMDTFVDILLEYISAGLIFIWVPKLLQEQLVFLMESKGCHYVENLVWYKIKRNNSFMTKNSTYILESKEILLIFKRGEKFEIRHQRNPDVIIDYIKPAYGWKKKDYCEPKPEKVYRTIEVILPNSLSEGRNCCKLLELWAKDGDAREGWLQVHELKNQRELENNRDC